MSDEGFPDLESVYDEQISPLMTKIIEICKAHRMPMLASFRFSEEGHCTTALPFGDRQSDKLRKATAEIYSRPVVLAETIVTNPDGSRHISIRRVT